MRRNALLAAAVLLLAACSQPMRQTASTTPRLDMKGLDEAVGAIAARAAPGVLGVGLANLESGEIWTFNGERPFPMQSVFKAPLGAAVLAEVDAGRLKLDEVLTIEAKDLSPPLSPIADAWPGRASYTVRELLTAAVAASDNTAADVLMKRIGGPGAVTSWLVDHHIDEVRIDRYERELQPEASGMASFRLAWKGASAYQAALDTIPPERRRAAMSAYLVDPRDTATPRGALTFLTSLQEEPILSPASRQFLLALMTQTATGPARVKAGLPPGSAFAHKTGTGRTDLGINPAVNDIGIVTLPDGRKYAVAVFLTGSTLGEAAREAILADVARAIVRGAG